ncbi:hypothetical protein JYU34_013959 [Plutella xylostella]|uniref:Uncharacterized protein n=1 Tax=Plutella xylostella TaxID=51655 RepID=A0ABQ7QB26_PLUXY|nr:hypothetical protein JYU34_013959 [Plutella xylostella]
MHLQFGIAGIKWEEYPFSSSASTCCGSGPRGHGARSPAPAATVSRRFSDVLD